LREFAPVLPPADALSPKTNVRHLVVVVPGIGGTELRDRDGLLWGLTPGIVPRAHRVLDRLTASAARLADPEYDDGVRTGRLVGIPVPGLCRLAGYRELRKRLFAEFALADGLTYMEFPYDWRRPNAHTAALLATAVEERLALVRERLNRRAEVVIVAHSMGGLVAREYLARHGGHDVCRRLITLGTPYRGSVKALDFLVNGPQLGLRLARFAEALREIPTLYEMLPAYPVIVDRRGPDERVLRVVEALAALPLDTEKVVRGREFLVGVNDSERPWITHPVAGFGPPTLQEAVLTDYRLAADRFTDLLGAGHPAEGGDGTVPVMSARPLSTTNNGLATPYDNQTHGGLVCGEASLTALVLAVRDALGDEEVLAPGAPGAAPGPGAPGKTELSAEIADLYEPGEEVVVSGFAAHPVTARLDGGEVWPVEEGSFTLRLGTLPGGLHRFDLLDGAGAVLMSDVIEVADA
jgi:pimeloyl-ACP methyl ester carboxylesterase